jgi:hypothetical protein
MKIRVKIKANGWPIVNGGIDGDQADVDALNELLDYILPDPLAALKVLKDHANPSQQTTEQTPP